MLNRTTSYPFQAYGDVLYQMPPANADMAESTHSIHNKDFDTSFISTEPVYLECPEGIALLAVSVDGMSFEEFVMARTVKLKAGVHFNVISISGKAKIRIRYVPQTMGSHPMETSVSYDPIISRLNLKEILSSYYQIRKGSYQSGREKNSFYELIYVDHGEMDVTVDDETYHMQKYDLMLYHPGQKHSLETTEDSSCSYMSIAFTMDTGIKGNLKNRVFHTRKDLYQTLTRFMKAIQEDTPLNMELAMLHLKEVLILLYQFDGEEKPAGQETTLQSHYDDTMLNEILVFIHNNVYASYTVEDLCQKFSISRSSLQALFRANLGMTPKHYISELKLNEAKKLISQHEHTISQVSDLLGFTSIHYFSRRFKSYFGIAPSEYAREH
ncbi:AraC family transcriptional regulator [Faecalibaculum rodentium]|uniref:AraC family transcriptional regulator n=1 Tax=Faecalibaculum rodentium TaxID=1702221 RepID=A0A1Q9YHB8_9FIRM|nr:AraC family transcriptional regulator [Faecalibaculum rodentium]OLU43554.1 AraC family transcriptional regulator [Faecalibaculum rodentium]